MYILYCMIAFNCILEINGIEITHGLSDSQRDSSKQVMVMPGHRSSTSYVNIFC